MARKSARLRDWLFGSAAKRQLLRTLLEEPERAWTKQALADQVGVHRKGGVSGHVRALEQLGLLVRTNAQWQLKRNSPLVEPLRRLLAAVEALPDRELHDD